MTIDKNKKKLSSVAVWVILAIVLGAGTFYYYSQPKPTQVDTSVGLSWINSENVKRVVTTDGLQKVDLYLKSKQKYTPVSVDNKPTKEVENDHFIFFYTEDQGNDVWNLIREANKVHHFDQNYNSEVPHSSILEQILTFFLPMIILFLLFFFLLSRSGGAGGIMGFGKARTKLKNDDGKTPDITFENVAGVDEAIEELKEIRDFMAEPKKFTKLGAKIPKGVLLYGPPGTGKTLLARAVAGEAKVPFFSISGSDFVEMFVGVGASRVRDLFTKAKQVAPSIIFIDEIDAVGRHRGSGMGGGHDEREQTLNQMLVEMDGFDGETNVLLIAATNRPDILDPALLRPGRFDRQVGVDAPNIKGREEILNIHAKDKPFVEGVSLSQVAKKTPGFTGADLANVINEAALLTARENKEKISDLELDEAIDRVMAGPQRKSRKMNDKDLINTAYHEGGHAIVAAAMHYTDPVTKITILPRGRALGYTAVMPSEDKYSVTRNELLDQMAYAMGGRVAEEIVFKDPSTGASNDIEKASEIAKNMVTLYGMSSKIGPVKLGKNESDHAKGYNADPINYSPQAAALIDEEIHDLLTNAHSEAQKVINENRHILDNLAKELIEKETLEEAQIAEIFKDVKRWGERPVWDSQNRNSGKSDRPGF